MARIYTVTPLGTFVQSLVTMELFVPMLKSKLNMRENGNERRAWKKRKIRSCLWRKPRSYGWPVEMLDVKTLDQDNAKKRSWGYLLLQEK